MTTHRSAAPKTRWSAAKKADARRLKQARPARRGDVAEPGGREDRPRRFERDDRPRRFEQGERPRRFEQGERPRRFERDDRPRRFEQGGREDRPRRFERDDRPRSFGRDDRPGRFEQGGRDDRPGRFEQGGRDDRPRRFEQGGRDDRPRRFERDDRPRRFEQGGREDRPRRFERDDRPRSFDRDDRPRRFDRDDRPRSFDRDDRPRRFERDDRPRRFERDDRPRRFERDDRPRRFERDDRPRRFERDDRGDRFERRPERAHHRPETTTHRPDAYGERLRRTDRVEAAPFTEDNAFLALGLPEALAQRLAKQGITEPFPIQAAAIPDALAGRDVLGRGRTGSGKTMAFGLPMLARLAGGTAQRNRPRALVLVPTRELAMQVSDALQPLVHVLGLRHKLVAGGMPYPPQIDALERGVDVLIATPGRMNDLVDRGAAALDAIEIAVLDEADHMADMGFLPEVSALLDLMPQDGQRLLFSATLDNGVDGLVEKYLHDPVTHSTDDGRASVTTMAHHILLVEPAHKKLITADVANRDGRTVVFVRTKLGADRVAMQLREQGVFAAALHGGLNQGARNRVLNAFRDGTLPVLVATDVAARGIHVDDVSVVLQVDPPADHKDYLHRAGRTARAGEAGTVVTLALPHQKRMMSRIATEAGVDAEPVRVQVGDDTILAATGARRPSGVPIPEDRLRRLLEGDRHRRGGHRPGGRGGYGARGAGRPQRSGGRPYRDR